MLSSSTAWRRAPRLPVCIRNWPHTSSPSLEPTGCLPPPSIRPGTSSLAPCASLFVGNLIPRKGLPTLIEAVALLPPGAAVLTVVGDIRVDRRHARRVVGLVRRYRLEDRVAFRGPLGPPDLSAEMAGHHVLAIPSTYEGYGMAYLEGMGHGLPAIAGLAGGSAEFVRHGENGLRVDPDDPPALAAELIELHRDRDRLDRMSRAALKPPIGSTRPGGIPPKRSRNSCGA